MTGIPKPAFERALASLDREELVSFVAALWAARGYRTDRGSAPGVVVAAHPDRQDETLYVPERVPAHRWAAGTVDLPVGLDREEVTVVVPDRSASSPGDSLTVESLYEVAMYAIGRDDLAELCRTHFGESPAALAAQEDPSSDTSPWRTVAPLWTEAGLGKRVTTFGIVALSVAVATALVFAGGAGSGSNAGTSTPERERSTEEAGATLAVTPDPAVLQNPCPDPPTGTTAGDLRPQLDSDALEGWRMEETHVVSVFDLMNRSQKATPEESFVGTYVGPDGRSYELRISRWEDPATARGEALDRRARWPVWEVWGAYSLGVRGVNGTAPPTSLTRAAARELLAAIETPRGDSLADCVDDLVEDRG